MAVQRGRRRVRTGRGTGRTSCGAFAFAMDLRERKIPSSGTYIISCRKFVSHCWLRSLRQNFDRVAVEERLKHRLPR